MLSNIKFIGIFSAASLASILFIGINSLIGIILTSSLGALAVAIATSRHKAPRLLHHQKWRSILICSSASAALLAALFTTKIYLSMLAIGVTGSPYDIPAINIQRLLFTSWLAAFASITIVLAIFDFQEY